MASNVADSDIDGQPMCPICLEAPPTLKVGTTCNHVFCRNCLLNHLKRASPNKDKFPCPTCHIDCPLLPSGIDGLLTANMINAETTRPASPNKPCAGEFRVVGGESDGQQCCQICKFTNNTSVDADKICPDCGNIHLCKACTLVHRTNKNTEHHHLIPNKSENAGVEGRCAAHGQWITYYCCTCSYPVCRICIHIAHGEHTLKSFAEVFHEKVEEVQSKKEEQEMWLKEFINRENALKGLDCLSLKRKGMLVKSIEDQAERCMEQITKQKEELKETIEADFKPILQLTACVDSIPVFRTKLGGLVVEAGRLVDNEEPCISNLDKLSSVSDQIDETAKHIKEKVGDQRDYLESYRSCWEKLPTFIPRVPDCNFGSLATTARIGENWRIDNSKLIFWKKLKIDDKSKIIPFVTVLGNDLYAVAEPTRGGELVSVIDIYRYPGVHQLTIRKHANPAYDLAATPNGNLAVLSDGKRKNSCCVRLFHPKAGYLRSTKDLDVRGWLSFDVSIHHQFVILSNDGNRKISIFNEDGSVVLTHTVDVNDFDIMNTACRIACSIRHLYVMGKKGFAIFEVEDIDLTPLVISDGNMNLNSTMTDISTNHFDQFAFCYNDPSQSSYIVTYELRNNEIVRRRCVDSGRKALGADVEARVSVRDNYIVFSQGQMIRVFQN